MRWLWWLATVVLVSLIGCASAAYWMVARSLPSAEPQTLSADVRTNVDVYFDERRRPFVFAESFEDAFFAQGYLHAQHRLWQMEMFRRAGQGRVAEAIGAAGLETDIALWRAGVPELARRMQRVASDELLAYIDAYVSGVNRFLQASPPLPPEFVVLQLEPGLWAPEDVFGLGALMAYQSANNLDRELLRLALIDELGLSAARTFFPSDMAPEDRTRRVSALEAMSRVAASQSRHNPLFSSPGLGSNAWAVAAGRSASGHALFAFDSHDSIALPNLTYDVHLFVGEAQIRGNSVAGLLGVINGFNEFMAWGFTNIGDSQDAFVETPHPDEPLRFRHDGTWHDAEVETVEIPVRNQPPHAVRIVTTRNGRLISEEPPIAVRWAPLEPHAEGLDALLKLNRATSYEAFNAALDTFVAPSAVATYADVDGRVAQRTVGLLPRRADGFGLVPRSGESDGWPTMLPMHELPRIEVGKQPFVVSANVPIPDTVTLVSADNAPGYRTQRIADVLQGLDEVGVDDMLALQTDDRNLQAEQLLPKMVELVEAASLDAAERQMLDHLAGWSGEARDQSDRPEPLMFATWYQALVETLFASTLSSETFDRLLRNSYLINQSIDKGLFLEGSSDWPLREAMNVSFRSAVAQLTTDSGEAETALWGDRHTLSLRHEMGGAFPGSEWLFNRGPYPASGGNATVGRARYGHHRPYSVSGGATTRMVLRMSQPIEVWMVSPGGQSGHPLSDWYNDQTSAWLAGDADQIRRPDKSVPDLQFMPQ